MHAFQLLKEAKDLAEKQEKRRNRLNQIMERSGRSEKEILEDIKRINQMGLYKINQAVYGKWDMFSRAEEDLELTLQLLAQRRKIKTAADEKIRQLDSGLGNPGLLREETAACDALHRRCISESMVEKYGPKIIAVKGELSENPEMLKETLVDMETMFFLFGYTYEEYLAFRFMDKDLEERLSFLSGAERRKVLIAINDEQGCNLFHDKHACYETFRKYFRRRQVCVYEKDDFADFQRFCRKTPVFVKKPVVAQKGRGVAPVSIEKHTDLKALMLQLLEENGPFVAEELIETHDALKAVNPDSVNTVRVETFYDGRKAVISNAFFRVGKAGFFVDNGSAGGIIVPIDLTTGRLAAVGKDKTNVSYSVHPDTGIVFEGYQIPNWKQLQKLSCKLAKIHPSVKYVGWDLTLNRRGKWVVVEGNARPGGLGVQRSSGKGTRADFFRIIGQNPKNFR